MSQSVGVSGVSADLMQRTAGGNGNILLLGVVGRLVFIMALLLSEVGRHCCVGLGVRSKVSSIHVGHGDVFADGGDIGDSCRLIRSSCLEGPLISA